MTTVLGLAAGALGLGLVAVAVVRWRRRRRAELVARLADVMRDLGTVVGRQAGDSSFEGVEGRWIVLVIDGKRLEVDVIAALEIGGEPDPDRRLQRLRWLVDQARIRQGV